MSLQNNLNPDRAKLIQVDLNDRLLKKLNKSIVFADSQFMEWFNLTIGIDALIKSGGALNIKEFSSLQSGEDYVKGVFFISHPLKGLILEILRDILISSKFQFITIITNLNPLCYDEQDDYFDWVKDSCLIWMENANYTCDILYERFPFAFFPHQPSSQSSTYCFLNPLTGWSSNTAAQNQIVSLDIYQKLVKQEINEAHTPANTSGTVVKDHFQQYYTHLTQDEKNELRSVCYSLNEMLEYLDAKDDCFSLGVLSAIVSNELNQSQTCKLRRKNAPNKVSLLLIDRNLDLSISSLFHEETVFDKMNNVLQNLSPTSNDVQVDLRQFIFDNPYKSIVPGNFFHFSTESCRILVEQFLLSKPKECLLDVYKKLCEFVPLSDMNKDKKTFRINADNLKNQMKNGFKVNNKLFFENLGLIQIISAYCQVNDAHSPKQLEFDKLVSYTKVLTQNIFDKEGSSVLSRIYGLFSEKLEKPINYSISNLIVLLIYVYGLIGEECYYGIEEEERIKNLLIGELESESFQNEARFKNDFEFINKITNNSQNYSHFIDKFFQNLKNLKLYRKHLKQYNKLLVKDEDKNQYTYKPLLKQVCENIIKATNVNNANEPLLDIEYRTSNAGGEGIKDYFKSFKIGYFNSSTKMHPLQNDLLIIYIVGGITSYEYKIVKEVFGKELGLDKNILIGSSHFYNHNKLVKFLLN